MKNLLRLEELAQFAFCVAALVAFDVSWWVYLFLALGPDVGMLGYLIGPRTGAFTCNLLHHKALGVLLFVIGSYRFFGAGVETILFNAHVEIDALKIAGIILYGHASMDRIFGYGLKFGDNFHHTHLGWIGKGKKGE